MRQHIINGSSINGNSGFAAYSAIVAGHDVRTSHPHTGKRLTGPVVPVVKVRPGMPVVSMRERSDARSQCRCLPAAGAALTWPQAALELPAAAWAALVIDRAQSA